MEEVIDGVDAADDVEEEVVGVLKTSTPLCRGEREGKVRIESVSEREGRKVRKAITSDKSISEPIGSFL